MKTNTPICQIAKLRFTVVACLLAGFVFAFLVPATCAQERPRRRPPAKKNSDDKADEKKPEVKKSEAKAEESGDVLAIVGGDIHTVTGPVIREGTILVKDGKITEVGQTVTIPENAKVIDAKGKTITPGFVAISMSRIAVRSTPSGKDKLADAFDPFDRNIKYALGVGITTGCMELSSGGRRFRRRAGEPEALFTGLEKPAEEYVTESMLDYGDENTSLCPCCGLPILPTEPITPTPPRTATPRKMSIIKLSYGNLEAMLVKESAFYSPAPGALNGALNRHNWRRDIKKAKEEIAAKEKEEKAKAAASTSKSSSKTGTSTSAKSSTAKKTATKKSTVKPELLALLKGETSMRVRANSVTEIRDMVDLANELGYRVVIEGGIEAWAIAQELGAGEVGVIYTPRQRRNPRDGFEKTSGSFVESPKLFQETGVPFAIATLSNSISMNGLAGRDLTSLPLEAAFAVRGGASEKKALEAVTITPAKMMGIEDRVGSIEKGKDADILILNGAPLDYRTYVEQAIVAGKVSYDRAKDRVYPVYDRN